MLLVQIATMKQESNEKDSEALERSHELDKLNEKVLRLETALQTALREIEKKSEVAQWWESKAGEQQQQLSELQR